MFPSSIAFLSKTLGGYVIVLKSISNILYQKKLLHGTWQVGGGLRVSGEEMKNRSHLLGYKYPSHHSKSNCDFSFSRAPFGGCSLSSIPNRTLPPEDLFPVSTPRTDWFLLLHTLKNPHSFLQIVSPDL